jgi:4-amino-4-deoxy-L-arabinose transferase-like glycosyltransferase
MAVGIAIIAFIIFLNIRFSFITFNTFLVLGIIILFIASAATIFYFRKNLATTLKKFYHSKTFLISLIVLSIVGVLARFAFIGLDYSYKTNDPKSYYHNAISLVETGHLVEDDWYDPHYVAFNPYIYNYIHLLKISMNIFGTNPASFIILNTFLDLIAATLIFFLAQKLKNRRFAIFAATLWLINPFSIVFCALPLPIVIVNTFLILCVFLVYFATKNHENSRNFLLINLALALALGFGNLFRPFMIIVIVAIAILYFFLFIKKPALKSAAIFIFSLIMLYIPIPVLNNISLQSVKNITGYSDISISSGWSMLLGSNLRYGGYWNDEDRALVAEIENNQDLSVRETHRELTRLAKERYLSYSLSELSELFFKKSANLTQSPASAIWYEMYNYKAPNLQSFLTLVSGIFVYIILIAGLLLAFAIFRMKKLPLFPVFILLLFVGLFLSGLLVEVMNRYFVPFLTVFILFIIASLPYISCGAKKRISKNRD